MTSKSQKCNLTLKLSEEEPVSRQPVPEPAEGQKHKAPSKPSAAIIERSSMPGPPQMKCDLHVKGNSNIPQFIIDANATQSNA
ncbi:MAG: hypothetical protein ABIQ11_04385 [Saprospiraceae bacterium]